MQRLEAIQRHAESVQARVYRRLQALGRELARTALNSAVHPMRPDGPDDLGPILAQVRLAADERHLACAEPRQRLHYIQTLSRGQLAGAPPSGSRSAMQTLQVARQCDLPHDVDRDVSLEVLFRAESRRTFHDSATAYLCLASARAIS